MKKKVLKIVLPLLLIIVVLCILLIPKKEEKITDYEIFDNALASYKYISTYDEYKKYVDKKDDNRMSKELSKEDFNNKKYLLYKMPIAYCTEEVEKDELKKEGNKYKLYFDITTGCGVCPVGYVTYVYEVSEELDVEVYTKITSEQCDPNVSYKPIIYIYPKEDMDLTVKLGNTDDLLYTYPKYNNIWNVRVSKNGNIYDYDTKRNYYGLYWEAKDNYKLNMNEGFVVKGEDSVKFLEEKLEILGLNEYEINEFIIYWIDKLENNKYNFISFRNSEDINMPLEFSEEPDTLIRVMMDFKELDKPIKVKEQQLTKVERTGFTIVEWGGTYHK